MKYQSIFDAFTPASIFILVAAVPLAAVLIVACTPDEELRDAVRERAREDLVTIKPRSGVECYVLRGATATNPRTMSCVAISTPNAQEAR